MNPELPPIPMAGPQIRPRRRPRGNPYAPPAIPAEERRRIANFVHEQRRQIDRKLRNLSQEQRRAVFLRLKHDRPLTQKDLAGTDLRFLSAPGADESLVISKKPNFDKLDQRMKAFGEGDEPARPKGTELATKLTGIELGEPKDRLSDELIAVYDDWVAEDWLIYEIEIASFARRVQSQHGEVKEILRDLRQSLGHIHGHIFEHEPSGRGARVVLRSTGAKFREFVEEPQRWRRIIFFDARPKFETFSQTLRDFNVGGISITPPPAGAETICVVDSGVAAGNPFLNPLVRRDISRSFVSGCSPTEDVLGHGSGVASLAAYYDLEIDNGGTNNPEAWICSARIMTDEGQLDVPAVEDGEQDMRNQVRLLSRILREIVAHCRPHDVRIYVLSFQILGHIWSEATRRLVARNSWVARTIDQLSREFDIVFVTITGNIASGDIADLLEQQPYPQYLLAPLSKVLDPGHASLAVTAGSIAHSAKVAVETHTAIAQPQQPSPFTRSGPGFAGSIKPDFVERGGNLVRDEEFNSVRANVGTNVVMASGKLTPALQHNNGTSFAAPRVAYHLAIILRELRGLGVEPSAPLLRAVLAASARRLESSGLFDPDGSLAVLGLGLPNGRRALDCAPHSALLFWQGEIPADKTGIFRFYVPSELSGLTGRKRIVVAVATAPPVQPWGVAEYLGVQTKFRLFRGDRAVEEIEALLQRDDDEPNIASKSKVEDLNTTLGINRRTKGTLQCDVHEWTKHEEDFSADDYTLAVTLNRASWCEEDVAVPVAVAVRIEDASEHCAVVYERVRARNQARMQARASAQR